MTTYNRIIKLIEKNNININKLEIATNLPKSSIAKWKNDKIKPSANALTKIAKYFNVSESYLLNGYETNNTTKIPTINIEDLTESEINEVNTFVEFLRNRKKAEPSEPQKMWVQAAAKSGQKVALHVTEEVRRKMADELEQGTDENPTEF